MDPGQFFECLKFESLLIICKWLNQSDLNRKRVFELVNDVTSFLQQKSVTTLFNQLLGRLSLYGESEGNIKAYKQMLSEIQNPFASFKTEHSCFNYLEKEVGLYFPPREINIDESGKSIQFIPVRNVLQAFFQLPDVFENTMAYVEELESSNVLIRNIIQTEMWKTKKASFENRLVLPLYLYQDDFETNNPLGSHRGIGKVGAVYIVPACLPPALRSKTENIFLLTLYKTSDADCVPLYSIFSEAIQELNFLEQSGITISSKSGQIITIHFVIIGLTGDNLAIHFMLGFTRGFTANFPCRFCLIQSKDINSTFAECSCELRTEENYQRDLIKDDPKSTGISRQSVLSDLKSSSTLSLMAVDIMHDIFEGVFEYDLGLLMHHFIEIDKRFTLTELNGRIENFDFGDNESRNEPRPLKPIQLSNKHIKMSAAEAVCFLNNIGVLIGDKIPVGDEHWQLIILLKEIIDIVTFPAVNDGILDFVESLVSEYLRTLIKLFGPCLKIKHHLLIHYASVSRRFGPLSNLSTMRCESKNRDLKMNIETCLSRKNVNKSIAIKCQLQLCYRFLCKKRFDDKLFDRGSFKTIMAVDLPNYPFYSSLLLTVNYRDEVKKLESIKFHGRKITTNVILMNPDETGHNLFVVHALIEDKYGNLNVIVRDVTDYTMYDQHFQAYELNEAALLIDQCNWKCVNIDELKCCNVSFITTNDNKKSYIPKRWI